MNEQSAATPVFSAKVIARLLNISERRLQQLAREGIVPRASRGKYPMAGCVRGYIKYLQEGGGCGSVSADPDQLNPFMRRAYYQGELDKLKLQQERHELVPRIEAEQEMAALLKIAGECFDTLPDVLERDCGLTPKALARMENHLDKAREDLYKRLSAPGEDAERAAG